jgi:hypothetical protein
MPVMLAFKNIDRLCGCCDQRFGQMNVVCDGADPRATVPCTRRVYATPPKGQLARIYNQFPNNIVTTITLKFERSIKLTFFQWGKRQPRKRFQRAAPGAMLIK